MQVAFLLTYSRTFRLLLPFGVRSCADNVPVETPFGPFLVCAYPKNRIAGTHTW